VVWLIILNTVFISALDIHIIDGLLMLTCGRMITVRTRLVPSSQAGAQGHHLQ